MTRMHGSTEEAVSLYCNLHGCARVTITMPFPSMLSVRKWFKDGVELPRGSAGKAQHLAMWNQLRVP